jgi:hypothetical protein
MALTSLGDDKLEKVYIGFKGLQLGRLTGIKDSKQEANGLIPIGLRRCCVDAMETDMGNLDL